MSLRSLPPDISVPFLSMHTVKMLPSWAPWMTRLMRLVPAEVGRVETDEAGSQDRERDRRVINRLNWDRALEWLFFHWKVCSQNAALIYSQHHLTFTNCLQHVFELVIRKNALFSCSSQIRFISQTSYNSLLMFVPFPQTRMFPLESPVMASPFSAKVTHRTNLGFSCFCNTTQEHAKAWHFFSFHRTKQELTEQVFCLRIKLDFFRIVRYTCCNHKLTRSDLQHI